MILLFVFEFLVIIEFVLKGRKFKILWIFNVMMIVFLRKLYVFLVKYKYWYFILI